MKKFALIIVINMLIINFSFAATQRQLIETKENLFLVQLNNLKVLKVEEEIDSGLVSKLTIIAKASSIFKCILFDSEEDKQGEKCLSNLKRRITTKTLKIEILPKETEIIDKDGQIAALEDLKKSTQINVYGYLSLTNTTNNLLEAITLKILSEKQTIKFTYKKNNNERYYENDYFRIPILPGWKVIPVYETIYVEGVAQKRLNETAINIIKNNYILYINSRVNQASGIEGGRFVEIAKGAPSADAVIQDYVQGECGFKDEVFLNSQLKRVDYYIDNQDNQEWCNKPTDKKTVWYLSYVTKKGGYINDYNEIKQRGWVVTMAYNSKNVNNLPLKESIKLKTMLKEMSFMVSNLTIK
ncbi:MAG: hypothetical protein KatS3mg097_577 [Candidatus Parcubacteria bacterium]|nr:MAG: hypothetical protein KatS3mg097_577 [Candidatus Parcubacteria bacterium]